MASSSPGPQPYCGAVLKVAIALQVLLLVDFLLSAPPHHAQLHSGHARQSAQRHWEKPQVAEKEYGTSEVDGGSMQQELPRSPPGHVPVVPPGRAPPHSRLCMGAPRPWDPRLGVTALGGMTAVGQPERRLLTAADDRSAAGRQRAGRTQQHPGSGSRARPSEAARAQERAEQKRQRVARAAALALEDERTSVGPRNSWCEREKQGEQQAADGLSEEAQQLATCIATPNLCRASAEDLRRAAEGLVGFQMLQAPLPCLFANGMMCPINTTVRNKETGYTYDSVPFDISIPDRDLDERFETCAVVGNGGSIMSSDKNGAAVDAHEAVFRFNDMLRIGCLDPDSPNAVLCNETEAETGKPPDQVVREQDARYSAYTGKRTTFRILNKKHALKAQGLGLSQPPGRPQYRPTAEERFVLWHYNGVSHAADLAKEFPDTRIYFLSANAIDWEVDTYSAMRRDLYSLGLGPFPCYSALSSGVHGLLLATRLCRQVSAFGFSLDLASVEGPVHFRPIMERPSAAHSWAFDTLALRFLHLTGRISACTA